MTVISKWNFSQNMWPLLAARFLIFTQPSRLRSVLLSPIIRSKNQKPSGQSVENGGWFEREIEIPTAFNCLVNIPARLGNKTFPRNLRGSHWQILTSSLVHVDVHRVYSYYSLGIKAKKSCEVWPIGTDGADSSNVKSNDTTDRLGAPASDGRPVRHEAGRTPTFPYQTRLIEIRLSAGRLSGEIGRLRQTASLLADRKPRGQSTGTDHRSISLRSRLCTGCTASTVRAIKKGVSSASNYPLVVVADARWHREKERKRGERKSKKGEIKSERHRGSRRGRCLIIRHCMPSAL